MPRIAPPVAAVALAALLSLPAAAQEATPVAPSATPEATACRVEPRPFAFYEDAIRQTVASTVPGTPSPDRAGGTFTPTPLAISGEGSRPADAATVAAVEETVREQIACISAGDFGRFLALYTEQGARDSLSFALSSSIAIQQAHGTPAAAVEAAAIRGLDDFLSVPPAPLPEAQRVAILDVRNVRVLADGRVVADIVATGAGREEVTRGVFAEEGGRFRVAGSAPSPADGTPTAATPQP